MLFPVVPDVKIIVATSSGAGLSASVLLFAEAALSPASDAVFSYKESGSSSWSSHTFLSLGHSAKIPSQSDIFLGLKNRASESERFIRSIKSSAGSPASSGTATVFPVIIAR